MNIGDYRDLVVELRNPDLHPPGGENPKNLSVRKRRAPVHMLAEVGGILQGTEAGGQRGPQQAVPT